MPDLDLQPAVSGPQPDPALPVLERARQLVEDLSFRSVREWREAHPHSLAVGYLPVYVPRPLLEAQGCLPVALFGGGDGLDVVRGDAYYQSYLCHLPRSTVELATSGRLDVLNGVVFPSTCDVIRNLGGMWQILCPAQFAFYLDLPQNLNWETGGRFYAGQLEKLAAVLHEHGARRYSEDALVEAIATENERGAAISRLDAIRRIEPWRLKASEVYLAVRAGGVLPAREHVRMLSELADAACRRQVQPLDNVRVVLCGSFCEQPPLALLRALEKAGCDIVSDDLQLGARYLRGSIPIGACERPVDALARAFLDLGSETACRYIGAGRKGDALVAEVKRCRADGVIFSAASFCDPALLDQPMLESALAAASVPYTSFKFAENTGQFQVIREQAGAFSDAVKLWGSAP